MPGSALNLSEFTLTCYFLKEFVDFQFCSGVKQKLAVCVFCPTVPVNCGNAASKTNEVCKFFLAISIRRLCAQKRVMAQKVWNYCDNAP